MFLEYTTCRDRHMEDVKYRSSCWAVYRVKAQEHVQYALNEFQNL